MKDPRFLSATNIYSIVQILTDFRPGLQLRRGWGYMFQMPFQHSKWQASSQEQ